MTMRIAVIGLGQMGGGIACNLSADDSFAVTVYDLNSDAMERCVRAGATGAISASKAVCDVDVVITSLPMPETVLAVFAAELDRSPEGTIWMDVSTIDPHTASELETMASSAGRDFIACPLGKGPAQAEAGTLPLFVGCREHLLQAMYPVFNCIGENLHYLGTPAAACTFKIVSNMVGMANLSVLAEGYALCSRLGVADHAFSSALEDTGAWSNQAELRLPWMMDGDFDNRFGVDLAVKDVRLAVEAAARANVPSPVGASGLMQLVAASAKGWGEEDVDAVLKVVDAAKCC